jgi:peptidoglycan/xylan/chitin deacetylase (PgdA/CDA1 family)
MKNFLREINTIIIKFLCFLFRSAKERPTVLMYHSVIEGDNSLSLTSEKFESQIKYLKENKFKFLKLDDLKDGAIFEEKSVLITFDDGYEDNFLIAAPILQKYNVPAVFFIATGLVGSEVKGLKMMNWEEIKKISINNLFEIGGHTVTHRKLHKLNLEEAEKEIKESKRVLEEKLDKPIRVFAYPYGRYNNSVLEIVKSSGFKWAFSTRPGCLQEGFNKWQIHRFGIDNFRAQFFKDIFKPGYELYWRLRGTTSQYYEDINFR